MDYVDKVCEVSGGGVWSLEGDSGNYKFDWLSIAQPYLKRK